MQNFNDKMIHALTSKKNKKDVKYYVREARGFVIQVMPSGHRSFQFAYRWEGKQKYLTLGEYRAEDKPDAPGITLAKARTLHQAAYDLLRSGIDPKAPVVVPPPEPEAESMLFSDWAAKYLEWSLAHHVLDWWKTQNYAMIRNVLPALGHMLLGDIKRKHIIEMLESVAKAGSPGQVHNVHKTAAGVFRHAVGREAIEYSPTKGLGGFVPELITADRDRTLDEDEIKTAWNAIEAGPGSSFSKRALKLVLITLQRPGEVVGMHRREIKGNWWVIPKARMKKRKGDHLVYLSPMALKLIGDAEGYIFPSATHDDMPMLEPALADLVSQPQTRRDGTITHAPYYGMERWTPHDLRRTGRTHMERLGILERVTEAIIAHAKKGIIGKYNRYKYKAEKGPAMLAWELELLRIIGTIPEEVEFLDGAVPIDAAFVQQAQALVSNVE